MRAAPRAARASLTLSLAFVLVGLGNYAFTLVMARMLTRDAFGVAALVQSFLLFASWLTASGFPWSTARRLARLPDPAEQAAVLRGALVGNLAVATGLAALLLLAIATGVLKLGDQPVLALVLGAAACSLLGLNAAAKGALQGLLKLTTVAAANVLELAVKLTAGVALMAAGLGVIGVAAGILAGTLAATAFTLSMLGRQRLPRARGWGGAAFYRETVAIFGSTGALALLTSLDVFGVKVLSPAASSNTNLALYQAAVTLARVPYFFGSALTTAVFPHIARQLDDPSAATLYLRKALLYLLTFLLPIGLTFLVAPDSSLALFFPASYVTAAPVLRVLALGGVALAAATVLLGALQAVGLSKLAAKLSALTVVLELVALTLAVRAAQGEALLAAVAACFDLALAVLLAALLAVAKGRYFDWRPRARGVFGLTVSASAYAAVLWALPHRGGLTFVAAVAAASAVYGALVIGLKVLSRGDLATLRSGVPPLRALVR